VVDNDKGGFILKHFCKEGAHAANRVKLHVGSRWGEYTQIVNVCDLSTISFCTGAALSRLDLFALVTVLNDLSAASASTMVVSAVSVIDL